MTRFVLTALCLGLIPSLARPVDAAGLRQVNPVKLAPTTINNQPSNFDNEYPMFSKDGKLMLWTRQDNSTTGDRLQWVWVVYIRNWQEISDFNTTATLPDLVLGTPANLSVVNSWVIQNHPGSEVKALALCEEPSPVQPEDKGTHWRYRFTLYLAIGPPEESREMYRAHRIIVNVNKADGAILNHTMSAGFDPAIPFATHPLTGGQANETEPMMTRDGQYLFWASNAWGGQNRMAHAIGPVSACTQLQQTPVPYSDLAASRFAWKDQYAGTPTYTKTSRTNYHAVVERRDGTVALIFEECQGQIHCDLAQPGNRDCECELNQNQWFSTTGFAAGGQPTLIANHSSGPLNASTSQGVPIRVTHPAISGPQHATNNSWILFFMRDRRIYYTKLKE